MDSEEQRARIEARLAGMLNGNTAQGSLTNGSFAFTEPEMNAAITTWLDLADSYDKSISDAVNLTLVEGPGEDFASYLFANAANRSGKSVVTYFTNNKDYCLEQAQLFQNALDDYLGIEHRNVTELRKTDSQSPPSVV